MNSRSPALAVERKDDRADDDDRQCDTAN
jgi:hypothetical protein